MWYKGIIMLRLGASDSNGYVDGVYDDFTQDATEFDAGLTLAYNAREI
jgi:hypothetical protein